MVLPVHDEEELLPGALRRRRRGGQRAFARRSPVGSPSCSTIAAMPARPSHAVGEADSGLCVIRRECRSVGLARRAGSQALLALWPEVRTPPDLAGDHRCRFAGAAGLAHGPAGGPLLRVAICGRAGSASARRAPRFGGGRRLCRREASDPRGQPWFQRALYEHIGGFRSLRSGEDRDFHRRAVARFRGDIRLAGSSHDECSTERAGAGRIRRRVGPASRMTSSRRSPDDRGPPVLFGSQIDLKKPVSNSLTSSRAAPAAPSGRSRGGCGCRAARATSRGTGRWPGAPDGGPVLARRR